VSVELKVTLVGDDPQQQQAFNQPTTPTAPPVQPIQAPPIQPVAKATREWMQAEVAKPASQPQQPGQAESQQPHSPEARLIDTIEKLIASLDDLAETNKPNAAGGTRQPKEQHQSMFDRFTETIDKKIDQLGLENTRIGNLVSGMAHSAAGMGSRASKFVSGTFGSTAVTQAASAGETAAGKAAASGAGAEVGAGAAGGALATAGPLIAVALAAGAAALSVKKFMEAVEAVAHNLSDLSPDIAVGQAQHEMRLELMRLDRAQRIGPDVASLDHAQHRLTESMYELQTKIYELILKASPLIETGVDTLNVIVRSLDVAIATANNIAATLTPDPTDDAPAAKALKEALEGLTEAWKELANMAEHHDTEIDPFLAELLTVNADPGKPPPRRDKGKGGHN
jgi:hypothetical protein